MFSALKHKGTPLYRIARTGGEVPRQPREITIHRIQCLSCDIPFVTVSVSCSSGTYIRTLCADIGARLSCGAHLTELHRVRSGAFHISNALDLEAVRADADAARRQIIPLNAALTGMPELVVAQALIQKIRQGMPVRARDIEARARVQLAAGQRAKIVSPDGRLVAVVECSPEHTPGAGDALQHPAWKTLRTFIN